MERSNWREALDQAIDARFESMVRLRRHLHAHPELSGEEQQTSLHLYQLLDELGFDVRMGPEGRGVMADLPAVKRQQSSSPQVENPRRPQKGKSQPESPSVQTTATQAAATAPNGDSTALPPRVALRADIDALRIHDAKSVDYRSCNDGVMHACGHDAHTSLVYGATAALRDLNSSGQLPWPIRLRSIFQPAEETCQGAREMIEVGSLEGVGAIMAVHVDPTRQVGSVGVREGVLTANCDEMQIQIVGRGGHAARPHEASDPIAAAAQLINALYLFIPRATDSQEAVVVTVGQIMGGENANVIPEEVMLRGTIRTLDRVVREKTFEHIRRLAAGIGETTDTKIEVHYGIGSGSVVNDSSLIQLLRRAGREILGDRGIEEIVRPSMGSEDFSFYLAHLPGAMIRLGCASPRAGGSALHTPTFDVDEEALRIGARLLARAAVFWCDPQFHPPARVAQDQTRSLRTDSR